jgi:2-C-methyl-D-erythritol 2,4-cyclodiphosphate synthase
VGLGIDLHAWDPGRPLHLGGVRFDNEPGLAGHSDGDVVCHALADALLGAAGLGDVGEHFPDSDPEVQGIGGLDLLAWTVGLLVDAGRVLESCDLTLIAERPRLAPRRDEIRRNLATTLGVSIEAVSVKATRPEGLGLTGDGVGCFAVALVRPVDGG